LQYASKGAKLTVAIIDAPFTAVGCYTKGVVTLQGRFRFVRLRGVISSPLL
jgi:hypothetical protein